MSAGRQLTTAVLGTAVAGGLALFAAGQRWAEVTVDRPPPLPPVGGALTGSAAAPLVPAMGLLLLAAAVALVAVRGAARAGIGLVLAVAGGGLAWSGIGALTGRLDVAAAGLPVPGDALADARTDLAPAWPVVVLAAGLLAAGTGVLVVLRGRTWPAMGRRYERPGAPAAARPARERTEEDRAADAWRALDRGLDPTADPPGRVPDAPGSGTQ
ncbi:Trp biosynthesis-associated membrane protein [Geodermatophilus sp. URMC 64]